MFDYDTMVLVILLIAGCIGMEFLYRGCKGGDSYMRVVGFCIIVVVLKLVLMSSLETPVEQASYYTEETRPDIVYNAPGGMGIATSGDNHTYGLGINHNFSSVGNGKISTE